MCVRSIAGKLCKVGHIVENFNPKLRDRPVQALNSVFYQQEQYERGVLAARRAQRVEADRVRRIEERAQRREARIAARRRRHDGDDQETSAPKRRSCESHVFR